MSRPDARTREVAGQTAIATSTLYNPHSEIDTYRSKLAMKAIQTAVESGYAVVVADGGSPDGLLREFEGYGARLIVSPKGSVMGSSRRDAMRGAYETSRRVVGWMEPEKAPYVPEIIKTVEPILDGSADMVVPERTSMNSYPKAQQLSEPFGNEFWRLETGHELDVFFGPKTWRSDLSRYFLDYNGEYGDRWDSIMIPVFDAIADGRRVIGVEVNYTHPKKQRRQEDSDPQFYLRRLEQLDNVIHALHAHWLKLHPNQYK